MCQPSRQSNTERSQSSRRRLSKIRPCREAQGKPQQQRAQEKPELNTKDRDNTKGARTRGGFNNGPTSKKARKQTAIRPGAAEAEVQAQPRAGILGALIFDIFEHSPACPVFGLQEKKKFSDYKCTRFFSGTQIHKKSDLAKGKKTPKSKSWQVEDFVCL